MTALLAPALEVERIEVSLNLLDFDPANLNKHSAPAIDQLAASISDFGLLNEPLVYAAAAGRFRVVAGEGRIRAIRQLDWQKTHVRCLKGGVTELQLADLGLVDNVLKEDLDPLAFGLYCHDDMQRTGRSAKDLARALNGKKDASTITRAVALVKKLPSDILDHVRSRSLPPSVAQVLTGLTDDQAKRTFAKLYLEGTVTNAVALAEAIRAARAGAATTVGGGGSFTAEEDGVRLVVSIPATNGSSPGQALAAAEAALRIVIKDLRDHSGKDLAHFKEFQKRKAVAARKAAELQIAQKALAGHAGANGSTSH